MINTIEASYKIWFSHDSLDNISVCDLTLVPQENTTITLKVRFSDSPQREKTYVLTTCHNTSWIIDPDNEQIAFLSNISDRDNIEIDLEEEFELEEDEVEELAAVIHLAASQSNHRLLQELQLYSTMDLPF